MSSKNLHNESDDDFTYMGEENDDIETESESQQISSGRINKDGKKVRGKDKVWLDLENFPNADEYGNSELHKELVENFTEKHIREREYGDVHNFICKFNRRAGFLPCQREVKVVFLSHCSDVQVSYTEDHKHEEDPNYIDNGVGYRWSAFATGIIETHIRLRPKEILRHLRDKNAFDGVEPDMIQLYNKVSHVKKLLLKSEKILTTHDLRRKIAQHIEKPESEVSPYIPYHMIEDEDDEDTRLIVIFATDKILSYLKTGRQVHVDATYRLTWQGYPVLICGVTSETGKFFGCMSVLSSHEDTRAWNQIFTFIHEMDNHFKFRMGDGASEITKAGHEVRYIHF